MLGVWPSNMCLPIFLQERPRRLSISTQNRVAPWGGTTLEGGYRKHRSSGNSKLKMLTPHAVDHGETDRNGNKKINRESSVSGNRFEYNSANPLVVQFLCKNNDAGPRRDVSGAKSPRLRLYQPRLRTEHLQPFTCNTHPYYTVPLPAVSTSTTTSICGDSREADSWKSCLPPVRAKRQKHGGGISTMHRENHEEGG